jgi:hypothetical protein
MKIINQIFIYLLNLFFLLTAKLSQSQSHLGANDIYINYSNFTPTIKEATKITEFPEVKDSVRKIENIRYGIQSVPSTQTFTLSSIAHAKMVNEPLSKLYHSLLKAGFGLYTTPYAEIFINNLRTRDNVYGFHAKHLSSFSRLKYQGYSGFSDTESQVYATKFFKKHALKGELNYQRNTVQFYGYDDRLHYIDEKKFTKQRFQLFEGKVNLTSYYTDSSKLNHQIDLNYYNLSDFYNSYENNIRATGNVNAFIQKEQLNIFAQADYYNNRSTMDTSGNFIFRIKPSFDADGKKWKASLGILAVADYFEARKSTRFHFYPQLYVHYNVYENIIVPYVGLNGGLDKNSFRSLSEGNPFIISEPQYYNTDNKYNVYGGLKGMLSSRTAYDVNVNYGKYVNMPFYLIQYDNVLNNRFKVVYNDATLLKVHGEVKYQYKEKINLYIKGNYYNYTLDSNMYAWHRPDFDITLSATYNLKNKIIIKADVYGIGNQWAFRNELNSSGLIENKNVLLNGLVDINLAAEYRYSKMLGFFVQLANVGNFRYYRWDNYPSQRFNAMIGLSFVPF